MRTFKALAKLFEKLSEQEAGFLAVHDEGVAKLLEHAVSELERMAAAWSSLADEEKAVAEAEAATWRPSKKHDGGEIAPREALPSLSKLLEEKKAPLRLGAHVYYPAGRWILRFSRGGSK